MKALNEKWREVKLEEITGERFESEALAWVIHFD